MPAEDKPGYSLAHPVYLDVPMMISFLAHLEGGVTTQEEETRSESGGRERAIRARGGFRFRFPSMVEAEAASELDRKSHEATSSEFKAQRHHTAASMFNLLYDYLREDQQLTVLNGPADLAALQPGQLIELAGEYLGNPLEDTLAFIGTMLPYLLEQQDAEKAAIESLQGEARRAQRSGNPAKRAAGQASPQPDAAAALQALTDRSTEMQNELAIKMMLRMVSDIDQVPVHDLLLQAGPQLRAVLTVSSDFYSGDTNQYLKEGSFRVIGKVTQVLTGDRTINLTRRTVLGAAGPEVAQGIIDSMSGSGVNVSVADPIVTAPAVQVLPMAIFV